MARRRRLDALPSRPLRYTPLTGLWTLYYCDQRDRFQLYPDAAPRRTLERLLDEIDADPTGIFWG